MKVKTIGIIGGGVVGRATARCFMEHAEVRVYDQVKERAIHSLHETNSCDIVFICLPEAKLDTFFDSCNPSVALKETNFVIKSTCQIGTTRKLAAKYGLKNLVHSPEFLTARCAMTDAQLPARNIIGDTARSGNYTECCSKLHELYRKRFPGIPVLWMRSDESEAVKLFTNSFFAVKIGYFNEIRALADTLGLNWEAVREGMLSDGRIAHSHTQVPGPDGKRGFGGACLPKDLKMLIEAITSEHLAASVLIGAASRNNHIDRKRSRVVMGIPENTPDFTTRTTCRLCGGSVLTEVLSLGEQRVSDFVKKEDLGKGPKCPITLVRCSNCTLVQQLHTARQDFLYTRQYWYRSGVTETMRNSLAEVARVAEKEVGGLKADDVVLDIGSNDGTLLNYYHTGVRVGVEPATNLATDENYRGLVLINDFWSIGAYMKKAEQKVGMADFGVKRAKIITALGMMYDMEDPNQFIADITKAIAPDGVFIAQLMCLKQMVDSKDVGNMCHEHLEFYSLEALEYLFSKHGLEIYKIEENSVNGGSYRLFVQHARGPKLQHRDLYSYREKDTRLCQMESLLKFKEEIETIKLKIRKFIHTAVLIEGKTVWAYGASTKGNVLLQYWGLQNLVEFAVDKSKEKVGLYTVARIPICDEEFFHKEKPDYALVLPYAFIDEFVSREEDWILGGGKFIVPLPIPMLVGTGSEKKWVTKELL